jgi:chitin disaccharide deacetylase
MSLRLILNADDFGYDPAVNRGIAEAMRHGIVSSTTMMVNSPHSEDAAAQADALSIGLHLNLVRFASLSQPGRQLDETTVLDAGFVAQETEAQLERLERLLGRKATHVDVHKHAHRAPAVLEGLASVARRHDLPVRSIDPSMRQRLREFQVRTNDAFLGDAGAEAYWTAARFAAQLDLAPRQGVVELMCHPGYRPSHVSSSYGVAREVELATFVSPEARQALSARGLRLEGWNVP